MVLFNKQRQNINYPLPELRSSAKSFNSRYSTICQSLKTCALKPWPTFAYKDAGNLAPPLVFRCINTQRHSLPLFFTQLLCFFGAKSMLTLHTGTLPSAHIPTDTPVQRICSGRTSTCVKHIISLSPSAASYVWRTPPCSTDFLLDESRKW
jgi:hypothetical protein